MVFSRYLSMTIFIPAENTGTQQNLDRTQIITYSPTTLNTSSHFSVPVKVLALVYPWMFFTACLPARFNHGLQISAPITST
jgi:hypothetical protein